MPIRKAPPAPLVRKIVPTGEAKTKSPLILKKPKWEIEGTEVGAVLGQIQEKFGREIASLGGADDIFMPRVPVGILALDLCLAGGWMRSRCGMMYGEKSSGKSTKSVRTMVNAQTMYPNEATAVIDIEGTFDETWFKKLGGDTSRLIKVEPESGEEAVDIADALIRTKELSMIVIDSIAMLVPMKEVEGSAEDSLPGLHARLIGNMLRRVTQAMLQERHREHRPVILYLNQFRMKIGVMFGDPRTLPGGKALEFATSQQVETKNKEITSDKGELKWNEHSFKITKDKTGGRFREGVYKMVRDPAFNDNLPEGYVDQIRTVIDFGSRCGLVSGTPQGGFVIDGHGDTKRKADDWQQYFLGEPSAYAYLQAKIVNEFRRTWGMPTNPDLDK